MENYETLGTIGEGTYGVVLKARHKETQQLVAIKKFKESDEDEQVRKTALREVRILKQLKHDNIVTLIEVFRRKQKLHLVFEFVERTILEDLENNPDGMDPIETKKCLWQLLRSISYCHAHNIIHRDIKPENLLVSKNGVLKLCDFGFARTIAGPGARYTDYVATRWYRSPELLVGDTQYGKAVDIWAIGCMLPEMASGAPLFPGESDIDQLYQIMQCFGPLPAKLQQVYRSNPLFIGIEPPPDKIEVPLADRFPGYPKEQIELMAACLRLWPEDRLSCDELMDHPYFRDDGFVEWFDDELKQMLERDASDFKMRQKKFRKGKGRSDGRSGAAAYSGSDSRPQSQPPAAASKPPPPVPQPPPPPVPPPTLPAEEHLHGRYGAYHAHPGNNENAFSELMMPPPADGRHGSSGELGPPGLDLPTNEARRPATRGSDFSSGGGGGMAEGFGGEEMPLLPNLQRPTTPRAQRLVAFPQLASALEDQTNNMDHKQHSMGAGPGQPYKQSWGGGGGGGGGGGMYGGSYSSGSSQLGSLKGGKQRGGEDTSSMMPTMPSLSQAMAPAMTRPDGPGGSNLPQLKEDRPYATDFPDTYRSGGGGPSHAYAPVPASRGGGGGGGSKKKSSNHDNMSNPYFSGSKHPTKPKPKSNKSSTSNQMNIVGQSSHAMLSTAYAMGPSALPPRTPNHDMSMDPPPGTPVHGYGLHAAGSGMSGRGEPSYGRGMDHGYGMTPTSGYSNSLYTGGQYTATGGQYAKYGKRY